MAEVSSSNNKNHHAHDLAFKIAMQDLRVAKDFLSHHLTQELQTKINLDSLRPCKGTFVDKHLRHLITDMLFRVNFKTKHGKAYLYLLCEHFSIPKANDISSLQHKYKQK